MQQLDPYKMQLELTGFLNKSAASFMTELWSLLLSAQNNPRGYPPELLEAAKKSIVEQRKAQAEDDAAVQVRLREHALKLQQQKVGAAPVMSRQSRELSPCSLCLCRLSCRCHLLSAKCQPRKPAGAITLRLCGGARKP